MIVSSDHRVGADMELTTDKVEKVKHKFLSPVEQDMIAQVLPPDLLTTAHFHCGMEHQRIVI